MVYIYILLLEKGKYYVGKTNNPNIRINNHFNSNGSAWTKKYKPLKIEKIIPNCDDYDEDKYTKIYMDKYGIDNVRGGSYTSITLNNHTIESLQKISKSTNDQCYICGSNDHFANVCKQRDNNVWVCSYCDREFDTYKQAEKHEIYYCKYNVTCYRCGRKGHYSNDCYAIKNIDGYYI